MKLNNSVRSFTKDKINTFVIILSLAIGLTFVNQIILFLVRELNTDKFQTNADRIYILKCDDPFNKGSKMFSCRLGGAEYMKENFSQVEDFCRIKNTTVQQLAVNDQLYYDQLVLFEATSNFFSFFSYPLLSNNPRTALETNGDIVISETLATRYFNTPYPVGKNITLTIEGKKSDYLIKGVFRKPLSNSHLSFDMVTLNTNSERYAYLLLKENTNPSDLEKTFDLNKEKIPSINDGTPGRYYLENLRKVYFDVSRRDSLGPVRDKSDLRIALIIGIIILILACFNYLGLINNKLLSKTHEFHIRYINGGSKKSFIMDFMWETLIFLMISFIISIALLYRTIPFFNKLSYSDIRFKHFVQNETLLIILAVMLFLLLVTLLFSAARIDVQILSSPGILTNKKRKEIHIPVFVVIQLTVSMVLLICSLFIMKQINFINKKDIGLDKEVIGINIPDQYSDKAGVFKEELKKNPGVNIVSITVASPLMENMKILIHYTSEGDEKQYVPTCFFSDENYISTLGINLIDGRNFSGNIASDKNNCLVNESFARLFKNQDLIGGTVPGFEKWSIIGIVKDFNYSSLKETIDPGIIAYNNNGSHLLVKSLPGMLPEVRKAIEETWHNIIPDYPVIFESLKDRYEDLHRENSDYLRFLVSCSLISLFLSMIGLFAVSFNSSRYRTKEVGLRKINGATIFEILFMLNKDLLKWICFAFLLASPVALYIMHKWLESYVYRINLNFWIFIVAGLIIIAVSIVTVSWQTWKAATSNPADTLRFE